MIITEINCFNINPEYYLISEYGNIYSKVRIPGQITELKPSYDKDGYLMIHLICVDGVRRSFRIHRLVAATFIPNPDDLPIVLHLNNIKDYNHYSNLKWGTVQENTQQAYNDGCCSCNTPVELYNKQGVLVNRYMSISDLCRDFDYSPGSITRIGNICKGIEPQFKRGRLSEYYITYELKPLFKKV